MACDLLTTAAIHGEITGTDIMASGVHATTNMLFSTISYYYAEGICNPVARDLINAGIDAHVDVFYGYVTQRTYTYSSVQSSDYQEFLTNQPIDRVGNDMFYPQVDWRPKEVWPLEPAY